MAATGKNHKKEQEKLPERDFFSEYNEIMKLAGRDLFSIESEWDHGGRQIKKFSLLKATPTPILTDHTNPINF
jgi:hypothetical protein